MLKTIKLPKILVGLMLMAAAAVASAENVSVAVAANFKEPLQDISAKFQRATGHTVSISAESSGKIVSQIQNGVNETSTLAKLNRKVILSQVPASLMPSVNWHYGLLPQVMWIRKGRF